MSECLDNGRHHGKFVLWSFVTMSNCHNFQVYYDASAQGSLLLLPESWIL